MNAIANEHDAKNLEISLSRDPWGKLVFVDAAGTHHANINVIPLFPISEPTRWVAILTADGKELACIDAPEKQPTAVHQLLMEELEFRDFVPRIRRVVSVSGPTEPCEWQVLTDHGSTRFVLTNEQDIRRLTLHEVMILDANGGRYRVDDVRQLDRKSRRYIEWYV